MDEHEEQTLAALERRASALRAQVQKMEAFLEELRHLETLIKFYRHRGNMSRYDVTLSAADPGRVSDGDKKYRDVMLAVRQVLLTAATPHGRLPLVYQNLPRAVKELVGGKDERVSTEILRHRLRDIGEQYGLRYEAGVVYLTDSYGLHDRARHPFEYIFEEYKGRDVSILLRNGSEVTGFIAKSQETGAWYISGPQTHGMRYQIDVRDVVDISTTPVASPASHKSMVSSPQFGLTVEERVVLEHLRAGITAREIAAALGRAENTVRATIVSIMGKLGASNHADVIAKARDLRVLPRPGAQ